MSCDDVECLIGLLSRRFEFLEALEDGSSPKNALERDLGVSRSTIDRAVRSLEAEGIVYRETGEVGLTTLGMVALDGYRQFRSGLTGLEQARPLFSAIDREEPPPFELFQEADVVTANRQSPHRPIVALQQFLDDAVSVKSIATGLLPEYVATYRTQIVEEGMEAEVVVQSDVLDDLLATYWDPMNEVIESGRFTVYETDEDPPYSIKVGETDRTEVSIITYGDQGVSGFIRTDSETAIEWAERLYERTKSTATLVAPMA